MGRTGATGTRSPGGAAAGPSWSSSAAARPRGGGRRRRPRRHPRRRRGDVAGGLHRRRRPADQRRPRPRRDAQGLRRRLRHLGRGPRRGALHDHARSPAPRRRSSPQSVGRALDGDAANAPTTWVPDSSLWRSVLARDPRLASVLPRTYPVVAATPVVFAAPRPMAEALGWPDDPAVVGSSSAPWPPNPAGWAAVKHPEWGRVRLEWPDPLTSTAGLGSTVAVYRDLADRGRGHRRPAPPPRHRPQRRQRRHRQPLRRAGRAARRRRHAPPSGLQRPADRAGDRAGGRRVQRGQAGGRGRGDLPDRGLGRQRGAGARRSTGTGSAPSSARRPRRSPTSSCGARPQAALQTRRLARRAARHPGHRRPPASSPPSRSTPRPSRARTCSPAPCRTGPPSTAAARCSSCSTPPAR